VSTYFLILPLDRSFYDFNRKTAYSECTLINDVKRCSNRQENGNWMSGASRDALSIRNILKQAISVQLAVIFKA
jgi:hypothetical protein